MGAPHKWSHHDISEESASVPWNWWRWYGWRECWLSTSQSVDLGNGICTAHKIQAEMTSTTVLWEMGFIFSLQIMANIPKYRSMKLAFWKPWVRQSVSPISFQHTCACVVGLYLQWQGYPFQSLAQSSQLLFIGDGLNLILFLRFGYMTVCALGTYDSVS